MLALVSAGVFGTVGYLAYTIIVYSHRTRDQVANDLGRRVDALAIECAACGERLSSIRDELHSSSVREDDIRDLRREMKEDFSSVFERLNAISREISCIGGRFEAHEKGST